MSTCFPVCASKPTATVWWFGPQNDRNDFLIWDSKDFGLSFAPQNQQREVGVRHASRFSGLLHIKEVELGFPGLVSRLVEARRWMAHVALSRRLRWDETEDEWINTMGYVGLLYLNITVFSLLIIHINRTLEDVTICHFFNFNFILHFFV
jgi:hypothetical protein